MIPALLIFGVCVWLSWEERRRPVISNLALVAGVLLAWAAFAVTDSTPAPDGPTLPAEEAPG